MACHACVKTLLRQKRHETLFSLPEEQLDTRRRHDVSLCVHVVRAGMCAPLVFFSLCHKKFDALTLERVKRRSTTLARLQDLPR